MLEKRKLSHFVKDAKDCKTGLFDKDGNCVEPIEEKKGGYMRNFDWSVKDGKKILEQKGSIPIMEIKTLEGEIIRLDVVDDKQALRDGVDNVVFSTKKSPSSKLRPIAGMTFKEAGKFSEAFKEASSLEEVK